MITWMQRHKKWLIITIWISTIAFVGAGFVGWGQYKYGDKAGAVAKVGEIEISTGDLQKRYSALYNQYNQMFQGNFDKEKAKQFGLEKQALKQLIDQSLIMNLANSYDLKISDTELLEEIKTQKYFFNDGIFDKEVYKQVLSRNNLTMKEYEEDVKKQLLIQKVLTLLNISTNKNEENVLNTITNISDKIEYKILSSENIIIDSSDKNLKPFWENKKNDYMTDITYDVEYLREEKLSNNYNNQKISDYYNDNKIHFKDEDGKIKSLENAKDEITSALNEKATKKRALKQYISFKKGTLSKDVKIEKATISSTENSFNNAVLDALAKANISSPYLKPIKVDDTYFTFKLIKINPAKAKSFDEAKSDVKELYIKNQKQEKLLALANSSIDSFTGKKSDFLTLNAKQKLDGLTQTEVNEFIKTLFEKTNKRDFIILSDGKIILYDILEQKLLNDLNNDQVDIMLRLKSNIFNEGLIKTLQNKYDTKIFIQGL